MVDLGAECTAGIGGLSYPGKIVRHIPPLDGAGYTNVIISAFAADYTFYYIIGEADGKGQQHLVVTNRVEHLRRQRSIVSAVNQDVAADCSKRLAGHRFGTDCSAVDRLNFTVFRRGIPDKAVRSEFRHHQRYTGPGNHPDRLFGGVNWHLPFLVYLFPLISIVLSFYLKKNIDPLPVHATVSEKNKTITADPTFGKLGIQVKHLMQIMGFYGLATYLVIIVSFNLPFLMKEYHFTSGNSGIMISLFFLAIMAPGFILNQIVDLLGKKTKFYCLLSIALGMLLILISRTEWLIGLGCIFTGFAYGVIQPIAYDKTTRTAIPSKVTLALAFVMAMNYLAILLCPFIINVFKDMLHIETQQFAFIFNMIIALAAAVWAYIKQDSFLFNDKF